MPKIKYRFSLTQDERDELETIVAKGKHNSQKVLNALILLNYDEDAPKPRTLGEQDIANVLRVSAMKIHRTKQRFVEESLDVALNGRKGERVYRRKTDGDFEAHLVALSCSDPPDGHAQWSLRLLADSEIKAWESARNEMQVRVNWQFTAEDARIKPKRLYPTLDM